MFSRLWQWLRGDDGSRTDTPHKFREAVPITESTSYKLEIPDVTYCDSAIVGTPPSHQDVRENTLYIVEHNGKKKWAIFRCPCDCGAVITLPLLKTHSLHWDAWLTSAGRITLKPSIWRDIGCLSHFIMKDGRVFWCDNTGTTPASWRSLSIEQRVAYSD